MAMLETASPFPDGSLDQDDVVYPCKGCGEILEEGKAFELAGNRWHIDCFRCNTCGTLLDSDANLLLLGDGSLICNNCTYSCSACNNKIEDLAILTGDQAFCANCFRCRNCKRKIDNLRYARTSQGIFCMNCHESLMARRRKNKKANRTPTPASNGLNKSLPAIPPSDIPLDAFSPGTDMETTSSERLSDAIYSGGGTSTRNSKATRNSERPSISRDVSSPTMDDSRRTTVDDHILLPASTFQGTNNNRTSSNSNSKTLSYADNGADFFGSVPFMLDPQDTVNEEMSPPTRSEDFSDTASKHDSIKAESRAESKGTSRDYFGRSGGTSLRDSSIREVLQEDSRSSSSDSRLAQGSPHIAHQAKERKPPEHIADVMRRRREEPTQTSPAIASLPPPPTPPTPNHNEFKLQEAPKQRKASISRRSSKGERRTSGASGTPKLDNSVTPRLDGQRTLQASPQLNERVSYMSADYDSPEVSSPREFISKDMPVSLPKRGDSLATQALKPVPRKEVGSAGASGPTTPTIPLATPPVVPHERKVSTSSQHLNGGRTISKPIESPNSRSVLDPPPRAPSRPGIPAPAANTDVFTAPRQAPPAPLVADRHKASASTSTTHSDLSAQKSPALPRSSTGGDFTMEEEMERIMNSAEKDQKGMFRKVSNAVKHGRSHSDRIPRSERSSQSQKWPQSPLNEISSPTSATSPANTHEENIILKNRLRQAQERVAKLEMEKNKLEGMVSNNVDMSQVNSELREKRSTMAFLDTQRELVVRELEVMTEHLRRAKDSNQALDVTELKSGVSRDFAASLQKLKDSLGKQIEELMQKRSDLTREIDDLIQMKDKGFEEYESLSSRNHQLKQHNNELIANIQGHMKANAHHNGQSFDGTRQAANGLGLYIQQNNNAKGRQDSTNDFRDLLSTSSEYSQATLVQEPGAEASVVATPHVVKIGKGKPNMLKKGTQGFVKGFRNMRGQLAPERQNQGMERNNSLPYSQLEGTPYNAMSQGPENQMNLRQAADTGRQKFGFFGAERSDKSHLKHLKGGHNNSNPSLASDSSPSANQVFGTELAQRCEIEKRVIPSIVSRCIEEVELRGMDVEGIYRKSGGTGQVNAIRAGFEKDLDYDISEPDLDIHAVTSALKQYLRKLPTPLITFDVYEKLLDCSRIEDKDARAIPMKEAINCLPRSHKDCLEFLVFHLAKVMAQEKDNLMTPLNLAVVFAPTIMRPLSIEREMIDMQLQRVSVQSILEMNQIIFGYDDSP